MDGWGEGCRDEWTDEKTDKCINGRMDGWPDRRMNRWMDGSVGILVVRWMGGSTHTCINGCMDR